MEITYKKLEDTPPKQKNSAPGFGIPLKRAPRAINNSSSENIKLPYTQLNRARKISKISSVLYHNTLYDSDTTIDFNQSRPRINVNRKSLQVKSKKIQKIEIAKEEVKVDNSRQVRKNKRSRRSRRSRRSITVRGTSDNNRAKKHEEEEEIVKWIECDSCKKWRVIPIGNEI